MCEIWVSHEACSLMEYDTIILLFVELLSMTFVLWQVVTVVVGIIMELITMMGIIASMVSWL